MLRMNFCLKSVCLSETCAVLSDSFRKSSVNVHINHQISVTLTSETRKAVLSIPKAVGTFTNNSLWSLHRVVQKTKTIEQAALLQVETPC